MRKKWFESVISQWENQVSFSIKEVSEISDLLKKISILNSGDIIWDIEKDENLATKYAVMKCHEGIQHWITYTACNLIEEDDYRSYSMPSNAFKSDLKFITPSISKRKININTGTSNELAELPVLGPKTAARIISHRAKAGDFNSLDELKSIKGIGNKDLERLKGYIFIGNNRQYLFRDNKIDDFLLNPHFGSFIDMMKTNVNIKSGLDLNYSILEINEIIILALKEIITWLEEEPNAKRKSIKVRSEVAKNDVNNKDKFEELAQKNKFQLDHVGRIGGYYGKFIQNLIESAENEIRLGVFFFNLPDNPKYPTYKLYEALKAAKQRSVDVKVLLDRDTDEDPYGSATVNQSAFKLLKVADIEVKFDKRDTLFHSKILIVDKEHIVVGSHNWTAGSFFQYEDQSAYLRSKELGNYYSRWFNDIWSEPAMDED